MYVFSVGVKNRHPILGRIVDGVLEPSAAGIATVDAWEALPGLFPIIVTDAFMVMPNHVHGIVFLGANPECELPPIHGSVRDVTPAAPSLDNTGSTTATDKPRQIPNILKRDRDIPQLGEVIRSFKAASTRSIRTRCLPEFAWQRNYWERIIRSDHELERFRRYIAENPARWMTDTNYAVDASDRG